jgi:hypothetical protein
MASTGIQPLIPFVIRGLGFGLRGLADTDPS